MISFIINQSSYFGFFLDSLIYIFHDKQTIKTSILNYYDNTYCKRCIDDVLFNWNNITQPPSYTINSNSVSPIITFKAVAICPVLSCFVMFCPVLSCLILPCPVLCSVLCSVLSCPSIIPFRFPSPLLIISFSRPVPRPRPPSPRHIHISKGAIIAVSHDEAFVNRVIATALTGDKSALASGANPTLDR